jgi:multidrug resistance protein
MGSFADQAGRRPAYILCFLIYISGNIALALQHSLPALLVLRGLQSCGSSGTVALASAVAADVTTSAERGTYMGITSLGNIIAPSLGPILGGILSEYLGWRAIFWFLALSSGVFFVVWVVFFPETCRAIVGGGSVLPQGWNRSVYCCWVSKNNPCTHDITPTAGSGLTLPNPLATLRLLFELPTGLILLSNGVVFASYYSVMAAIPFQLETIYHLSDLEIGLSFIPAGIGSLTSATSNGIMVDWNYRRAMEKAGLSMLKSPAQGRGLFSIEKARLQIGLPMTVCSLKPKRSNVR